MRYHIFSLVKQYYCFRCPISSSQEARQRKHERSVKYTSRSEDRRDYRPIRPGAKPGERFLRGPQLRSLLHEGIPGLATSQASLSFGLPQGLCLLLIDPQRVGIVGYLVDVACAPVRDDLCFDILHHLLRVGIQRVSVARAPRGEAEGDDISLAVGTVSGEPTYALARSTSARKTRWVPASTSAATRHSMCANAPANSGSPNSP